MEITVFGRPGAVDPAIYSYVRFMGISYNENFDIFTGTFVHRLPGSYQACVTVPVPQDALRLPYAQFAIDKYLTDRASMGLLGEIETRQKYCRNARVLAAESPSGRGMVFTLRERLPASRQNLLSETALSIVRLASVLPKTFVSKHPLVPNIAAEFYQRDNVLDARIFCTDQPRGPFAYKLDSAACQMLASGAAQSCRVALVFDVSLPPADYSNSGLMCDWEYTGNAVFTLNKNKIVNRLVLISDEKLPGL